MGLTSCCLVKLCIEAYILKNFYYFKEANKAAVFEKDYKKLSLRKGNLVKNHQGVTLESTFEDLEADSLDLFQVISEIEDTAFDIQIETEEGLSTVGDLVAYVEEKLSNNTRVSHIPLCLVIV